MTDKLRVESLRKSYGSVIALDSINLSMRKGEFLTLLGPSGSGKSTLLWAVAGLNQPDAGTILIDGKDVSKTPAFARDLGMVFQNYALFPHMSVGKNIGFPLKMRRQSRSDIEAAVTRALDMVQLAHVADRSPAELSGGQQQRIALARALVYEPSIVLLDEPLGALDKNLRDSLQLEIKALHERLGITMLYVTHDQEEAMVMSDRICLMNHAKIAQIDTPAQIYTRPQSLFAAEFLGESNLLPCDYDAGTARLIDGTVIKVTTDRAAGPATLMIRPDAFGPTGENRIAVVVEQVILAGAITKVFARTSDGQLVKSVCLTGSPTIPSPGDTIHLHCAPEACVVLDPANA